MGRLRDVQKCSDHLIEKVHDYFNNITRSTYSNADNTKLLIPGYLVTKIIGARGCMIREIAARSGGTQIKILSDKSAERDLPEIVVSIAGSLKGKQEASAIILEQIELFKNGGPVLTTGSCLNDNIATQYKNSVQGQDSIITKTERRRPRLSSSESSRRRRSRSSSLEEKYIKRKDSDIVKPQSEQMYIENKDSEFSFRDKQPSAKQFQPNSQLNLSNMPPRLEETKNLNSFAKINNPPAPVIPQSISKSPYDEELTMKSILNLDIERKVKPVPASVPKNLFKISLLFSERAEAKRFKDYLDWFNSTNLCRVEYDIAEIPIMNSKLTKPHLMGATQQVFSLSSNPVTIAEIIKTHANKEVSLSTGDNATLSLPK